MKHYTSTAWILYVLDYTDDTDVEQGTYLYHIYLYQNTTLKHVTRRKRIWIVRGKVSKR